MYRLFLIADTDKVSTAARKAASGTGGVEVKYGITPFKGCPNSGDAGNPQYAILCRHLKQLLSDYTKENGGHDPVPHWLRLGRDQFVKNTHEELLGDYVEAALGAAEQMLALQEYREGKSKHWKRVWSQMWGRDVQMAIS